MDVATLLQNSDCHLIGSARCCAEDEESVSFLCEIGTTGDLHPAELIRSLVASDTVFSVEIV